MSGEACGTVGRQSHGFLSLDQPFHRLSLGFLLRRYHSLRREAEPNTRGRRVTETEGM